MYGIILYYSVGTEEIMILNNLEVKHKSFGNGTVVEYDGKYMSVKFATAVKKFVYPDAFESFLSLVDGSLNNEIMSDIAESKRAKQAIIDKKHEENLRAMTRGIVIPGKEASSNEGEDEENRYKETDEI